MMDTTEQLRIIADEYNPFLSARAGDPWKGGYPDVDSINKSAFEGLCRILRQKARRPDDDIGAMVLGETGSGKTHLIKRLLRYCQQAERRITFAYIQPILDADQTFRYLLREITVNLCGPSGEVNNFTQLHSIVADVMFEFLRKEFQPKRPKEFQKLLQRLEKNPLEIYALSKKVPKEKFDYVETKAIEFLTSEYPELPEELPRVMFQYRLKAKRRQVINWLKCEDIDEDAASLLGVRSRQGWTEDRLEQEAHDILKSLSILLARYKRTVLVCFDRLEALETPETVGALGNMVLFLTDEAKGMLPVVFARGQFWRETLSPNINQQVPGRIGNNCYKMDECNSVQALEIIKARLKMVFGEEHEGMGPFEETSLRGIFPEGRVWSPGVVIARAKRELDRIAGFVTEPPTGPLDKLVEEYETQYEMVLGDLNRYQPDRDRLHLTLELLLRDHPGGERSISNLNLNRTADGYIDCTCKVSSREGRFDAVIMIDVKLHHRSVAAALRRGVEFLERSTGGKALYLRDGRCPFPGRPRWPQTNEMREQFEHKGGKVHFLDDRAAARWYALALLSFAVKAGDGTIDDVGGGMRPVTMEEFHSFIREKIHGGAYPEFQCILDDLLRGIARPEPQKAPEEPTEGPTPKEIAAKVVEVLRPVPMMMMTSKKLAGALKQTGLKVDVEAMLLAIGEFPDRFEIIPSRDGVLVLLKREWVDAQS